MIALIVVEVWFAASPCEEKKLSRALRRSVAESREIGDAGVKSLTEKMVALPRK